MQNCHQYAQWRVNLYQRREPYSSSNNSMPFSPILESPLLNVVLLFLCHIGSHSVVMLIG